MQFDREEMMCEQRKGSLCEWKEHGKELLDKDKGFEDLKTVQYQNL